MANMQSWFGAIKEYAKDYVLENTGLKILALLITAVLWLSVASRPSVHVILQNVPIEFRNLPETTDLIISKYEPTSVRVSLSGPRDVVDTLRAVDLSAVADMTGIEPGVRVVPLKLDRARLPSSVEEQAIEPHSIVVTVERVVGKDVPVKPRFEGEPMSGYQVLSWKVTPSTVHIVGAASIVQAISEVSTETVSLAGKTASFSEQVAIIIGSPNVSVSDENNKVQLVVSIEEVRKERIVDKVPVTLIGAPVGVHPVPRSVKVTLVGPRSAIEAITADDISVTVSYQRGRRRNFALTPSVTLSRYADEISVRSIEPNVIKLR
jgi:YbbR domain-containing protein